MVIFFAILTTASAMAIGLLFWRWQDKRKERAAWVSLVQIAGYPQDLFDPAMIRDLPELVQRYFLFTISPGAPLPGAVEIEMTGELGLGTKDTPDYRAMHAEEILAPPHGLAVGERY